MPTVNGKKYPYTTEGMVKAEAEATRSNPPEPIRADQSVYGESNMNPMMNPDSNTLLTQRRNSSLRKKAPSPYKLNRKLV